MRKLLSYAAVAAMLAQPAVAQDAPTCIFHGYLPCTLGSSPLCQVWAATGLPGEWHDLKNLWPAECSSDVAASREITKTVGYCQSADNNPFKCPQ